MNGLDGINLFSLLNTDGKKLAISNVRNVLTIVISILYFGSASKMYLDNLVDIATELIECILLTDNALFPTIKRDSTFLNILEKFNKLQKIEEANMQNTLNRLNGVESPVPAVCLPRPP